MLYAVLVVSVFIAYANCFSNEFLFDDEFLIQKNAFLRSWSSFFDIFRASSTTGAGGVDSFYRPLQTVSYLFVFQIFGLSTFGFHLLNVTYHAVNSCLLMILGQRLGFGQKATFAASLLWALHPVHTEAVTYMSATADPLYTLFCLLGCIALFPSFSWRRGLLATFFFAAGLLSKEAAIVFPALAVACRFATAERPLSWRSYVFTTPLWMMAILYLIARKTILDFDESFTFYRTANIYTENFSVRLYTFFATLPSYLELLIFPRDLHMERRFPVFTEFTFFPVLTGLGLALGTFAQLVWSRGRRGHALAWGILWFWAAHVPHTGILIPVNAFFLEHWMYLPSIGLIIGSAESVGRVVEGRRMQIVLGCTVGLCAFALGGATYMQNRVWRTPIEFYSNILRYNDQSPRIHNNIAIAYGDQKDDERAMKHYLRAIEIADEYPQTRYNLALLFLERNNLPEALKHLHRALEINPDFYHAYGKLFEIAKARGNEAEAKMYFDKFHEARRKLGL